MKRVKAPAKEDGTPAYPAVAVANMDRRKFFTILGVAAVSVTVLKACGGARPTFEQGRIPPAEEVSIAEPESTPKSISKETPPGGSELKK